MPSLREIRRRIRSVKSTSQITRAMEMVSAVKMRRAQEAVLASRPYAERMLWLLQDLAEHVPPEEQHPLLEKRPVNNLALLVVTADRGLIGALNSNIIRQSVNTMLQHSGEIGVFAIGRRGRDWMASHGRNLIAEVSQLGDRPRLLDISPIARAVIDGYTERRFDRVDLVYNQFVSTSVQRVIQRQLLPVDPGQNPRDFTEYIFEPNAAEVMRHLLPRFVEVEIYQALLESVASEHSARMIAMHNATENAKDVIQNLTLQYNKTRQASITNEILEIASGANALQNG